MVEYGQHPNYHQLIISPNRSASWDEVKFIVLGIALVTGSIAVGWWVVGVWIILPFAGFEVSLLFLLMYVISRNNLQQQVITMDQDTITVSVGITQPSRTWQLVRDTSYIEQITPRHPDDTPIIFLHDDTNSVRIGEFLNKPDATLLIERLAMLNIVVVRDKWWL